MRCGLDCFHTFFFNPAFSQFYVMFPSTVRCCQIILLHGYYYHMNIMTRWFEGNRRKCAGGQSVVGVDLGDLLL